MRVGVPTEIKNNEFRVALTPAGVAALTHRGHDVIIQAGAGDGSAISDRDFKAAGAEIVTTAEQVWAEADLLLKVKEPIEPEYDRMRRGQTLFTYLHLAASPPCTQALLASGTTSIAYETVQTDDGALPLLAPMSEVAGRLSIQAGAHCLEKGQGGSGVLLGGVPGVEAARVVVVGGGVVGSNAIRVAMGMRAHVAVLDNSLQRLKELDFRFGSALDTVFSTREALARHVSGADLVIGAVLVPGARAPKLVTRDMVKAMRPGSVVVDVAIDQGGCCETSRPTTHAAPTFVEHGVVHYCVSNMPAAVARTAAFALNNATLPLVLALANQGYRKALAEDPHLRDGLNVHRGHITCAAVAQALGLAWLPVAEAMA